MSASPKSTTASRRAWLGLIGPLALATSLGCSAAGTSEPIGQNPGSGGSGGSGTGGSSGGLVPTSTECQGVHPGRAQIRRLTRFEYNSAVQYLFGDSSEPASALPPETISRTGNLFGNDAALLSVSSNLAGQWGSVAEGVAQRATSTPEALGKLAGCAASATPDDACTRSLIQSVVERAYHRDSSAGEIDGFLALQKSVQATSSYADGVAAVIEAVLQGPEFLYRVELGAPDPAHPELRKPSADEMAARLSFLFWGTLPDEPLRMAAKAGLLATADGVRAQAERLVNAPQARPMVRFFFDNLLPISGLTNLARDTARYPVYTQAFAAALREETQTFLEHELFDADAPGTWSAALTAPYTYVNEQLAAFYGMPGVVGPEMRKVAWPDPTKRMGLLTQAGIMTGTITTNESNPVLRGSFVINKLLCLNVQLPTDPAILAQVKVPEGVTGATARERFTKHRSQSLCAGCHALLDPVGFALENFDAVGQWRDTENGVTIDASGSVPTTEGAINGPVELVQKLATAEATQTCFAQHWMELGYGKTLDDGDACVKESIDAAFKSSGGNVKQLLVSLTQTDAFLYLPAKD